MRGRLITLAWLGLGVWWSACGGSGAPEGGTPTPAGSGTPLVEASGTPGSSPSQTPGATVAPTGTPGSATPTGTPGSVGLAYCAKSCKKVSDCVASSSTPLTDENNWSCDDGICISLGCQSTSECTQTYGSKDYSCESVSYVGVEGSIKTCVKTCSRATDCDLGISSMDKDNYSCNKGICQYLGCNGDRECPISSQVCRQVSGYSVPYCLPGCSSPSDCASSLPAYDRDNYACEAGVCAYSGCNSSQECSQSSSASYVLNVCVGL